MANISLPGLNVQTPWAQLLLEGKKTIETRTYPLPEKYQGKDLWLIETPGKAGKFKARVIGVIRFSGSKKYKTVAEFNADYDLHQVGEDDPNFSWKKGELKFGWILEHVKIIQPFDAPSPRGIVYCGQFENPTRKET